MKLKTIFIIICAVIPLILSGNVWAEGERSPTNLRNEAAIPVDPEKVIQHIHNQYGSTAAGVSTKDGDVHMSKGEKGSHGHSMHPHTVQGGKGMKKYRNMTAVEYRKEMFGSNN